MKTSQLLAACSIALVASYSAQAQTPFEDLDFESATLSPAPVNVPTPTFVPIASALPGWSASIAGVPVTQVQQNSCDGGQATIDIFGPNYPTLGNEYPFGQGTIDGNYTVFLQSGGNPQGGSVGVNTSIWQTGTVPANSQSLEFMAWSFYVDATFSVSFAGNSLSPVVLSSEPTEWGTPLNLYAVNITTYAGETGVLEFTSTFNNLGASWTELDDITFSPNAVPEPGTLALLVVGGVALAARRWRAKASCLFSMKKLRAGAGGSG
jgi:hypothetical protein